MVSSMNNIEVTDRDMTVLYHIPGTGKNSELLAKKIEYGLYDFIGPEYGFIYENASYNSASISTRMNQFGNGLVVTLHARRMFPPKPGTNKAKLDMYHPIVTHNQGEPTQQLIINAGPDTIFDIVEDIERNDGMIYANEKVWSYQGYKEMATTMSKEINTLVIFVKEVKRGRRR